MITIILPWWAVFLSLIFSGVNAFRTGISLYSNFKWYLAYRKHQGASTPEPPRA